MREPGGETLLHHAAFLRALARSILGDEHAAEDVAQEALMAAGHRPGIRAWLGAVARNLAVSRLRSDRRRARREEAAARPEAHGNVPEAVARLEAQQRVVEAVLALEPPYRAVVLERFFYDRPLSEVASHLGVPVATARTRLRRALAMLKATLERRCGPAAMVAALALLARPATSAAFTGAILMSTKTKVALVALMAVLAVWLLWASTGDSQITRDASANGVTAPDAPGDPPVPTTSTGEAVPLLTGRCIDFRDATPLAGASVRVAEHETVTDAAGRFAVPWQEGLLSVAFSKEGYSDSIAQVPSAATDLGDIRMKPCLGLRGIVLTPEGPPAPGATVVVRHGNEEVLRAVSNAAGRFSIPLPEAVTAPGPTAQEPQLLVAAHLTGFVEGEELVTDANHELRIQLRPARTVSGVVVDAVTGNGVAGAELMVRAGRHPLLDRRWRVGTTGADGTFEVALHPLPERAGSIVPAVVATAAGYAPCQVSARHLREHGNRIVLEPSMTVRGKVVHADGRPAPGIPVVSYRAHLPGSVSPASPEAARLAEAERRMLTAQGRTTPRLEIDRPPCTQTRSDADGEFAVEVGRASPFRIDAGAWPLGGSVDMLSAPQERVTIVVTPRGGFRPLRVRVIDVAGGPISGASVWQANVGAGMNPSGGGPAGQPAFRTDSDGYAEVWPSGSKDGALFVAWATDWSGVSKTPVDPLGPDAGTPEIVCDRTGTVRGRVVGPPLHHGARASLWMPIGGIPWRMQIVRVGRDGRFTLPGTPPGRCTVVVAEPTGRSFLRALEIAPGEARDLGDIALDPAAIVQGVVRMANGDPAADAMVFWQPVAPYEQRVFADLYWERGRADESGAFSIPVWSQGTIRVWAQGGPFTVVPDGVPQAGKKIPFGKTVDVECRPGDGPVTIVIPPGR